MYMEPQPEQTQPNVPASLGELIQRLDWRVEGLGAMIVLAESVLVYLVASLLLSSSEQPDTYPFWIVALVMLAAHFVTHLLDEGRVISPDFEMILGGSIIVSILLAIKFGSFGHIPIYDPDWLVQAVNGLALFENDAARPVWGAVILTVYAWARARFRDEPSLDSAYTMLKFGTLALGLILIIVLAGAPEDSGVRDQLSIGAIGFFAFTLAAVGIARMRIEGVRASAPLSANWLVTFFLPIAIIVLLALVGAGLFSRQLLDTTLWVLTPIFWVLSIVFQILVLIIAVLAYLILTPIFWLIGDRVGITETQNATATIAAEEQTTQGEQGAFEVPEPLRYVIAAVFLFLIISALIKFVFRRRRRAAANNEEQRESVLDWSDLLGNLGDKLRSLFDRDGGADPYAHLRGDERWRYTVHIRETYRRLQERGASFGRARKQSETAPEYGLQVTERIVDPAEAPPAVDRMTEIYRQARYSGEPAVASDADDMSAQWEIVERAKAPPSED